MIELQHLTVGYGKKAILSDINQTIESGQLVCLLGANGVGKSTILRTIAGFQPPLCGTILLNEQDMTSFSATQRSKAISVVLTERIEVPCMNVVDLIGMGRSPYTGFFGTLTKEDKNIIYEAIDMVGISHLATRTFDTLSDGERQKVLLAKALAQQTPVILLDEPTAFLDFHAKVSTLRLLLRLAHETNKTILLSTHDVEMAIQLSDALWIVQNGEIKAGTTLSLTESGTLKHFLQIDPMADAQKRNQGIIFDTENLTLKINNVVLPETQNKLGN
ncbi:MAG: ABC transporter ATP-binding protein [Bacteroidaceae bacterium]|nr:ABC transporter ATP-binding protein [Bacteroidaceae bacterium]